MRSKAQNRGRSGRLGRGSNRIPTEIQAARFDAMRRAGITQRDVHDYLTSLSITISYPTINHVLWDRFENEDVEKAVAKLTRTARATLFPETSA